MTNEQLRKEILEVARKVGATESSIVCGSLFCKFNKNIHNVMANNLKTVLQKFFDKRKPNDTLVKMSCALTDYEYAYDFTPVVDFRLNEYGI